MGSSPSSTSRHVPIEQLLPPSATGRAIAFAGTVAIVGAVAWALLIHLAHVELGWLAWGIGAAAGFAAVKAGGHGTLVGAAAALLTFGSIATGKHFAYRWEVDRLTANATAALDASHLAERERDAADWVALGSDPSDEQIATFLDEHGFEPEPPRAFAATEGVALTQFHSARPTLEQWREEIHEQLAARVSFVDYLKDDFHPFDIVFVLLGIGSAFGLVSKHTTELSVRVRQEERRRREAEAEAEASQQASNAADADAAAR